MAETLKLWIKYNNTYHELELNFQQTTFMELKDEITEITNIDSHYQFFPNLSIPGTVLNDNTLIKDLELDHNLILEVQDIQSQPVQPVLIDDIPAEVQVLHISHEGGEDQPLIDRKFKALASPRKGRKLVVFDIDQTLYDGFSPTLLFSVRPHLDDLLTTIYRHYDIGIWTEADLQTAEAKINLLDLTNNHEYKILFIMDKSAMIHVPYGRQMIPIKLLDIVWSRYDQYNKRNTLMCDDLEQNIYFNNSNGLLIEPYSYKNYYVDMELAKLKIYLQSLSHCDDFSALSHTLWNQDRYTEADRSGGASTSKQ